MTNPESHPSFGVAIVSRVSSSPGASMFQSDLLHSQYISLRIARASRTRALSSDWVHPDEELLEVRMSLAQWGALVSAIGIGSGVPVTIVRTESAVRVEEPPFEPRMQKNLEEVDAAVGIVLEKSKAALSKLTETIEDKGGAKAIREALTGLNSALGNAESNSRFAVDMLAEAAEMVVSQARSDIEASILAAQALTGGQASVEAPSVPSRRGIEVPEDGR